MFQQLRPRDLPLFCYVSNQHGRYIAAFRRFNGHRRDPLHLVRRAGPAALAVGAEGLYAVDDHKFIAVVFRRRERGGKVAFAEQVQPLRHEPEPPSAQRELARGFLSRDVQHAAAAFRHFSADLQQKGGLPHPRLAAEQRDAALHPAAAKYAVKLLDAGWYAFLFFDFEAGDRHGGPRRRHKAGFRGLYRRIVLHCAP